MRISYNLHFRALQYAVATILKNPKDYEWTLQGLGMLRLYLSTGMRLHVWSTQHAVKDVSVIHDHPWDFHSVVLCGRMIDMVYEIEPGEPTHHEQSIMCGVGAHTITEKSNVRLALRSNDAHYAEDTYNRKAEQLHQSMPINGTVTLIDRTRFLPDRDLARVFFPLGTDFVSAEPRPATLEEVQAITQPALDLLLYAAGH